MELLWFDITIQSRHSGAIVISAHQESSFEHERFLRGVEGEGKTPNFRVAYTVKPEYTNLHKCWTYALESFIQTLTTMNVVHQGDNRYRTETVGEWTKAFREEVGWPTFEEIFAMNECLPLRQGIPND